MDVRYTMLNNSMMNAIIELPSAEKKLNNWHEKESPLMLGSKLGDIDGEEFGNDDGLSVKQSTDTSPSSKVIVRSLLWHGIAPVKSLPSSLVSKIWSKKLEYWNRIEHSKFSILFSQTQNVPKDNSFRDVISIKLDGIVPLNLLLSINIYIHNEKDKNKKEKWDEKYSWICKIF